MQLDLFAGDYRSRTQQRLDRGRIQEDVQAMGVEGAIAYHLDTCCDEEWLRATAVEVAAL